MSTDPAIPYPPRYRWLKRLTVFYVALFVAVLSLRLCWGWEAQRKYGAVVEDLRSRGEPTREEEIADLPVADGQNMVPLLNEAEAKAVRLTEVRQFWNDVDLGLLSTRQLTSKDRETLRELVTANAAALDAVSRAATRKLVQWTPSTLGRFYLLRPLLELNLVLALEEGRSGDAVRIIRELFLVAQAFNGHPPSFNSTYAPTVISSAIDAAMRSRIPNIRIDDANPKAASRAEVESLIAFLLDDRQTTDSIVKMYRGERITTLALPMKLDSPWIVRPLTVSAAANYTHFLDQRSIAAGSQIFAQSLQPPQMETIQAENVFSSIGQGLQFYMTAMSRPNRHVLRQYQRLTSRRALAVLLAIRLHAHEHAGQIPRTLEALVPGLLPAVPVDPFASDRHALRYVFHPVNPIVYSIGENGIDNGGTTYAATDGSELSADLRFPYRAPLKSTPADAASSGENDQKQEKPGGGND